MSQTPPDRESPDTLLVAGEHLLEAVHRIPQASELEAPFQSVQDRLDAAEQKVRQAERRAERPRVWVELADLRGDAAVRMYQSTAKTFDSGQPGTVCNFVLPDGITPVVTLVGQSQVEAMKEILSRHDELAKQLELAALAAARDEIAAARDEYTAALTARQAAAEELAAARMQRDLAREDWITAYVKMQGRVKELFPRNRRKYELFWYEFRSRRAAPPAEEEPATPAGDGAATPVG